MSGRFREVVHLCPPRGFALMPCCDRSPFECLAHRLTRDPSLVTCTGVVKPKRGGK